MLHWTAVTLWEGCLGAVALRGLSWRCRAGFRCLGGVALSPGLRFKPVTTNFRVLFALHVVKTSENDYSRFALKSTTHLSQPLGTKKL